MNIYRKRKIIKQIKLRIMEAVLYDKLSKEYFNDFIIYINSYIQDCILYSISDADIYEDLLNNFAYYLYDFLAEKK